MLRKLRKIIIRHSICAAQHPTWTYNSGPILCRAERHSHPAAHQAGVDVWNLSKAGGAKELSFFDRFATTMHWIKVVFETVSSKMLIWVGDFKKSEGTNMRSLSNEFEEISNRKMKQEEISYLFYLERIALIMRKYSSKL